MGVPKFYRWISERYPKINEIVSDNALLPEFDHLYLDMNGIIHGCTHPSHMDIADVISERDMMLGIMHYLDRIITQIVKPKKSVYMAIDGVAPRAKLNQQRSRRFRSAKDMAEATKDLPKDSQGKKAQVFDSNCITPGTEFLAKVSKTIQYFIRKKIKEDPLWHGLTIIFSGHDIPGEGEHKIMQHIREMRHEPQYEPNTRHCIYGQDADLIMLGLVTHEPHFTILREVVDFNFSFNNKNSLKAVKKFTKESDFQLLHLSVVREYLQIEFCYQQPQYDLERTIDDFVFMTFLVGNDFLPHMPTLDIGDGAFDLLFDLYKEQRSGWGEGNYLTQSGEISDPHRLEVFIQAIGAVETDILIQREKDDAAYLKKRRKWDKRDGKAAGPSDAELAANESAKQEDYLSMIENMMAKANITEGDFVDGWTPVSQAGDKDYKGRYYYEKMKITPVDKDEHWQLRRSYMEGLMWCLAYYYRGCISWGWFYPYHYGPMLSDLRDIPRMFEQIKFEIGSPLSPFEQLMGCLPPASGQLVPKLYRWLMTSPDSPIIQFYPENFEVDMNGKKNPWEGVNLLPFIDIALLKETIARECPASKLSEDERVRNSPGIVYGYKYDLTCTDIVKSPNPKIGLPDIVGSHSSVNIMEERFLEGEISFEPKLIVGTTIPFPGFPSLNVLPIASIELTKMGLNCFGSPSKHPNTILTLHNLPDLVPLEVFAKSLLGESIFVNWPMMHEARVVALSDGTREIKLVKGQQKEKYYNGIEADRWNAASQDMLQMYHVGNGVPGSGGVNIGEIKIRLRVLPLQGMKTNPINGSKTKLFGQQEADVPLQLCLLQAPYPHPDPRFEECGPLTLQDRFPLNCEVILTKGKYRGCKGTVISIADQKSLAVNVQIIPPEHPFGLAIARSVQESYISSGDAARVLKIPPGVFGKVTGRLQFEQGKYDLGLHLKSADGMCVVGYTRKKLDKSSKKANESPAWAAGDSLVVIGSQTQQDGEDKEERIQWEYTPKAIRLIDAYRQKFPQLFSAICRKPNEKRYDATQVFGPKGEAWLPVIREWLNNHESAKLPRSPVTTDSMSYEAIAAVQKAADVRGLALKERGYPKESLIKIPGSALYREGSTGATDVLLASDLNDNEAPVLGDRVVNLCADGIPFGSRGTVVGIHEAATTGSVEVVMDDEFMGGSSLQGSCSNFRGKLCVWAHLLKVSPENAESVVDKLVPKGSSRSAVNKIISHVDNDITGKGMKSSWDSQVDSSATNGKKQGGGPSRNLSKPRSSSRTGSTGRGKQGGWREARGPDEKGTGFKWKARAGKSGLQQWKKHVAKNSNDVKAAPRAILTRPSADTQKPAASNSAELKAILGVSQVGPVVAQAPGSTSSDTAGLKAMLGVGGGASAPYPQMTQQPVVYPHMAQQPMVHPQMMQHPMAHPQMMPPPMVPPQMMPQPGQPMSAADKLMQMMASKRQVPRQPAASGPVLSPTGFSFGYVEEGQSGHAPQPQISQAVAPVSLPGYIPPQQQVLPSEDFPPLGGATRNSASDSTSTPKNVNGSASASSPKQNQSIVPSVVATKGKH